MKVLMILVMLLVPSVVFGDIDSADLGDFNGLNDIQKAKIVSDIAKAKAENSDPLGIANAEQFEKKLTFVTAISKGITMAAKDLGMAANEFIKTGAGKITVGLIAYKILGKDFIKVALGTGIWVVISLILIWSYRRTCLTRTVKPWFWQKNVEIKILEPIYDPNDTSRYGAGSHNCCMFIHAGLFVAINFAFICAIFSM